MRWLLVALGQQVAGELLDRELVERHVVVQGFDDPIAIGPHLALAVDRVAVAVGIAGLVEPVAAPAFAVVGGGEELFDVRCIGPLSVSLSLCLSFELADGGMEGRRDGEMRRR